MTTFLVHGRVLLHDRQVIVGMVTVQIVLKPEKQTFVSRDTFWVFGVRTDAFLHWADAGRVMKGDGGASNARPQQSSNRLMDDSPLKRQCLEIWKPSVWDTAEQWTSADQLISTGLISVVHTADTNECHGKLRRKISWHCSFNRHNTHVLALLSTVYRQYRQYSEDREIWRSTRPFLPPFPN